MIGRLSRKPSTLREPDSSMDAGGYTYALHRTLDQADGIDDAIRITILNYMHGQLGLSLRFCEDRVRVER
jgi:hypothetical protein